MLAYGPVPSRRLGYSLGINHIPVKYCSYSCIYCQVGRTSHLTSERQEFYPVDQIFSDVDRKVTECLKQNRNIDYLTLVPDGEPTLDKNLGKIIEGLKRFRIPVAVISNASLIDRDDVQEELAGADWVSLKVDSVEEILWKKINRPHRDFSLSKILDGMFTFKEKFAGELVTETMLIGAVNDNRNATNALIDFLLELKPDKSYLSIPIRPPAETGVTPPASESLKEIINICNDRISCIEFLFETEVGDFISTGNIQEDILSITSVHPLREKALRDMIARSGESWKTVEDLLHANKLTSVFYRDENYFLRIFDKKTKS